MQLFLLETNPSYKPLKITSYHIQSYGERNDFPQQVLEVIAASVTGASCCKIYQSFIAGKGFKDERTYQTPINYDGETMDDLLKMLSADYAHFQGFALHVNYNANFNITSVHAVPFENVRLGLPDENGKITSVYLHPDWGKRNTNVRKFDTDDIDEVALFNPTPETIQAQVIAAGGWDNYKGQVYYYSSNGRNTYPLPVFVAALTDMNTEEAISDITNRNARNGFLPAGLLVDICQDNQPLETREDGTPIFQEENDTEKNIQLLQGSKNAAKVAYVQVGSRDEIPEFVSFNGTNYDKEYTASRDAAKDAIGRAFNQPPILRAENVGSGFGAEVMQQAYNYYNSVTTGERLLIERVLTAIFKYYMLPIEMDFTIAPLSYEVELSLAERLGDRLTAFNELIASTMNIANKRSIARTLYGLNEDEINAIFPIEVQQPKTDEV